VADKIDKKTKALDPQEYGDVTDDLKDETPDEPYGAQVLRRLHEDHSMLLKDYDDMLRLTENDHVKKLLTKKLQHKASFLDEIENCWKKSYKDLPTLVGMDEEDQEDESNDKIQKEGEDTPDEEFSEDMDADKEVEMENDEEVQKDMDTMDDDGMSSAENVDREEEEPTGEEAYEATVKDDDKKGKKFKAFDPNRVKPINERYGTHDEGGGKYTVRNRQTGEVMGGQLHDSHEAAASTYFNQAGSARQSKASITPGSMPGPTTPPPEEDNEVIDIGGMSPGRNQWQPHESKAIGDAAGFLDELSQPESVFDDEGRMKSYHYHKTLEGIASIEDMAENKAGDVHVDINSHKGEASDKQGKAIAGRRQGYVVPSQEGGPTRKVGDVRQENTREKQESRRQAAYGPRSGGQAASPAGAGSEGSVYGGAQIAPDSDSGEGAVYGGAQTASDSDTGGAPTYAVPLHKIDSRSVIGEASKFFKQLSMERAFGDPHRQMSGVMFGKLKSLIEDEEEEEEVPEDEEILDEEDNEEEEAFEPGEMGEKSLNDLARINARQQEQLQRLTESLNGLVGAFGSN